MITDQVKPRLRIGPFKIRSYMFNDANPYYCSEKKGPISCTKHILKQSMDRSQYEAESSRHVQ